MIMRELTEDIRMRAYEIWEGEGRPEGRDRIHWMRAEAEFRDKFQATQSTVPKKKTGTLELDGASRNVPGRPKKPQGSHQGGQH